MYSVNAKSFLLGGLVVVLVLCLLGAEPFPGPGPRGRYRIETGTGHAFVLDTITGQVWSTRTGSSTSGIGTIDPNSPFSLPKAW